MSNRKERPALGELVAGQDVIVVRSPNDSRRREPGDLRLPARIIKASRVWIEIERSDLAQSQLGHRTWRMRRDTQDEGTQFSGSNARFVTLEQNEWEETRAWGQSVLREMGIDLRMGSMWAGREADLADALVAYEVDREDKA